MTQGLEVRGIAASVFTLAKWAIMVLRHQVASCGVALLWCIYGFILLAKMKAKS